VTTAVVLFTRDLRVHDHPALAAAISHADHVVPLFVLDDAVLRSRYASPNRVAHLLEALRDLRTSLQRRGGTLVVRRGDFAEQVRAICVEVAADALHLSADVSTYARRREADLRRVTDDLDVALHLHPGITVVPPGELVPSGSRGAQDAAGSRDHFRVFTPYWRRWVEHGHSDPVPAPARVAMLDGVGEGVIPDRAALVAGEVAPDRRPGGETAARAAVDAWFADGIERYDDDRDRMDRDGTSRLSAALHLGTVSPREVVARIDRRRRGHEAFLRQLCWRDFNHQLLAARPDLITADLRGQGDDWRDGSTDPQGFTAWKEGRTGYPVVDAAMRQLVREGYVHNRARMLVASFLTKHLRIDWRLGAWHFMDHLEDGDLANNFAGWQWAAGTGTDSRPNRLFNPVTQGRRYDPEGTYIRRYLPELRDLDAPAIHAPWEAVGTLLEPDYPPPIVEHGAARDRFLTERGRR
jgi:deoxyribodipyrimidine photo-lyase